MYKVIEKFIFGERWNHFDDFVWSVLSHKLAKSMRCVDKIAYIYEKNSQSITRHGGSVLELKNILTRHEVYEIIFDKNTEKYFYGSINELISKINHNKFFFNLVKTDEEIKIRTIKIISNYISLHEDKSLNTKRITSFLDSII